MSNQDDMMYKEVQELIRETIEATILPLMQDQDKELHELRQQLNLQKTLVQIIRKEYDGKLQDQANLVTELKEQLEKQQTQIEALHSKQEEMEKREKSTSQHTFLKSSLAKTQSALLDKKSSNSQKPQIKNTSINDGRSRSPTRMNNTATNEGRSRSPNKSPNKLQNSSSLNNFQPVTGKVMEQKNKAKDYIKKEILTPKGDTSQSGLSKSQTFTPKSTYNLLQNQKPKDAEQKNYGQGNKHQQMTRSPSKSQTQIKTNIELLNSQLISQTQSIQQRIRNSKIGLLEEKVERKESEQITTSLQNIQVVQGQQQQLDDPIKKDLNVEQTSGTPGFKKESQQVLIKESQQGINYNLKLNNKDQLIMNQSFGQSQQSKYGTKGGEQDLTSNDIILVS